MNPRNPNEIDVEAADAIFESTEKTEATTPVELLIHEMRKQSIKAPRVSKNGVRGSRRNVHQPFGSDFHNNLSLGMEQMEVRQAMASLPFSDISSEIAQIGAADPAAGITRGEVEMPSMRTAIDAMKLEYAPAPIESLQWPEGQNPDAGILGKMNVHPGQCIYSVHMSPNEKQFVTTGQDRVAKIWDAATGQHLMTLNGHSSLVMDAQWSPDGSHIYTASYDKTVRQYSATTGALEWDSGNLEQLAIQLVPSPDGKLLTVRRHELPPVTIDLATKQITTFEATTNWVGDMRMMSDGKLLMTQNGEGYRDANNRALIADPATGKSLWKGPSLGGIQVTAAIAVGDGTWIAVGGDEGEIVVVNQKTNQVVTLPRMPGYVHDLETDPTGTTVLSMSDKVRACDLSAILQGKTDSPQNTPTFDFPAITIFKGVRSGKELVGTSGGGASSRLVALDLKKIPWLPTETSVIADGEKELAETDAVVKELRIKLANSYGPQQSPESIRASVTEELIALFGGEEAEALSNADTMLSRFHVITQPWGLEGASDVMLALESRGKELTKAAEEFGVLKPALETMSLSAADGTPLRARISETEAMLAGSIEEWMMTREDMLLSNTTTDVLHPVEAMGAKTTLSLPTLGGNASLQNWQGVTNAIPTMEMQGAGFGSHGTVFSLDLSGAEHLVTNVSFTVTSEDPNTPVTVRFYRGTALIGLETVNSGDLVNFSDIEGITSMLIANAMREMSPNARAFLEYWNTADAQFWEGKMSGGAATRFFYNNPNIPETERSLIVAEAKKGFLSYDLSVSDLTIAGNANLPQVDASPLSIENNDDLSRAAHPFWGQSGETLRRGPSPGYLAIGRFAPNAYGIRRDVNQYSAVRFLGINGAIKPTNVSFHNLDKDLELDPDYYEIVGNTVILRPGAPEQIVIYLGKEGGGDPQGINVDVEHQQSMSDNNLLPPETMSIRSQILAIRGPNTAESIGPALTEIRSTERPVTIGSGNVLLNVWNDGRQGGTVRVITNPETPGAKEVSFALGAAEGKSVSMGFTVPADGQLKIRIILPDGTILNDGKPLKMQGDSDERRIAIKQGNGTYQLLWVALNDPRPTVSAAIDSDPGFAVWKQEYIARTGDTSVADPANFPKAFITYLETKQSMHASTAEIQQTLEKQVDALSGDIETVMNKASLTHIKDNAEKVLASAIARSDDYLTAFYTKQLEAVNGLIALIPEGSDAPMIGISSQALKWKELIERTTSDPESTILQINGVTLNALTETDSNIDLGTIKRAEITNYYRKLSPNMSKTFTFELTETAMVNMWTQGVGMHDLSLSLKKSDGTSVTTPTQNHAGVSGESISMKLGEGKYIFTIKDDTNYGAGGTAGYAYPATNFHIKTNFEVKSFNSASIEGKISIEASNKVISAKMRVAEFESNGKRNENYDGTDALKKPVDKLNPNLPVWIMVHGRANSENSSQILELTRNLKALDVQVITIDWEEGAKDNFPGIGLEGSKWIETVGFWSAQQLKEMGFQGNNINVIGHSWGSYVAYEIGAHMPGGIQALVALDPAADTPLLGGGRYKGFKDPNFSFSNVSPNSYAFHSSNFGNRRYALSAKYSFDIQVPENYENSIANRVEEELFMNRHYFAALGVEVADEVRDALNEHPFAVSLFSELLERQKLNPNDQAAARFSLNNLRSTTSEFLTRADQYEGTFFVDPERYANDIGSETGKTPWKAKTFGFRSKDASGNDIIQPRSL